MFPKSRPDVRLADRFHPLLAFFLLFPWLALAGDVAAVAFGGKLRIIGSRRSFLAREPFV
jgi:hypothetical protein